MTDSARRILTTIAGLGVYNRARSAVRGCLVLPIGVAGRGWTVRR